MIDGYLVKVKINEILGVGFWFVLVFVNGWVYVCFWCPNGFLVLMILINGVLLNSNSFSGFSFLILIAAILALKEDARQCAAPNVQPVLEEFIPLKKDCGKNTGERNNHKKEKDSRDKKNWMSSVQLWNTDNYHRPTSDIPYDRKQVSEIDSKVNKTKWMIELCFLMRQSDNNYLMSSSCIYKSWQRNEAGHGMANDDPFQTCKNRNGGRAFMPFKAYPAFSVTAVRKEDKEDLAVYGLSLLTPGIKNPKEESASSGSRSTCGRAVSFSAANVQSNLKSLPQQPTARKQRRCWSPELHRRFVNALQQLGGSQG